MPDWSVLRRFRERSEYCIITFLVFVLLWRLTHDARVQIHIHGVSFGDYVSANLYLAIGSTILALLWPVAAWQRIWSIGLSKSLAAAASVLLLGLWVWGETGESFSQMGTAMFLILQLPIVLMRARNEPGSSTGET